MDYEEVRGKKDRNGYRSTRMAGKLKRQGSSVRVRHVAEVLAGVTEQAAIGDAAEES